MKEETIIKGFLVWQAGKNGNIPHWTDGHRLYDASELAEMFLDAKNKK